MKRNLALLLRSSLQPATRTNRHIRFYGTRARIQTSNIDNQLKEPSCDWPCGIIAAAARSLPEFRSPRALTQPACKQNIFCCLPRRWEARSQVVTQLLSQCVHLQLQLQSAAVVIRGLSRAHELIWLWRASLEVVPEGKRQSLCRSQGVPHPLVVEQPSQA